MPPSVCAGDAHRPIPPFDTSFRASIHERSSRFSVNTPLACATRQPVRHDASSHSTEKALRRSFDNFNDRKAAQVLHAFEVEAGLVLAHIDIADKSNEIPAAQQLLGELNLAHSIVTLDAMHCQKKPSRSPRKPRLASSSS